MDKTPLLSVVIPAYNCEDLLDETVGSVLGQLPDDCELIIVDDGSSDGTAEGLRALEGTHRNLRVCYAKHSGVSGARNRGLDLARGEYVTFMDCDDCYRDGFLGKSLPLTRSGADLYIFGIERIPLRGTTEYWTVEDGVHETAGAFADRYVRCRQLLIYSNCNKFYRREVIRRGQVHFDEGSAFGEDRLFNYAFLRACKDREGDRPCVITSSLIMLRYIQRSDQTASSRHVPGYFERVMRLHEEKMSCFLALSEGTTEEERLDFEACDLAREVEKTIDRFARHPEERDENLPLINQLVFGGPYDMEAPVDILVILGSSNCGYRVECALQISKGDPEMTYVVSGGNPYKGGSRTEAEYMAEHLRMRGVEIKQIHLENKARFTRQNLLFSSRIVQGLKREAKGEGSTTLRIGIITGGFHIRRTMLLEEEVGAFAGESVEFFPAYGPMTQQDNWIDDPEGRELVLTELRKTLMVERAGKGCRKEINATSRG